MEAQDDPTWTLHLQRCQQNVAALHVDQPPPPFSAMQGIVTSLLTAVCALPHLSAVQRPADLGLTVARVSQLIARAEAERGQPSDQ